MKVEKITINKSPQQPNGIEVEIVQPDSGLEERLLSFLLASFLRELKRANRIPYDLPDHIVVDHRGQGTFLVSAPSLQAAYYEPPRPIAIFGIRTVNGRFDLIHAAVPARPEGAAAAPQAAPTSVASADGTSAAAQEPPTASAQAPETPPSDAPAPPDLAEQPPAPPAENT